MKCIDCYHLVNAASTAKILGKEVILHDSACEFFRQRVDTQLERDCAEFKPQPGKETGREEFKAIPIYESRFLVPLLIKNLEIDINGVTVSVDKPLIEPFYLSGLTLQGIHIPEWNIWAMSRTWLFLHATPKSRCLSIPCRNM